MNVNFVTSFGPYFGASLGAQTVKNLPAMQENHVQYLGQEIPWRREWQPTPVFFPGKSHGQRICYKLFAFLI